MKKRFGRERMAKGKRNGSDSVIEQRRKLSGKYD
jgi:hypothetical protein